MASPLSALIVDDEPLARQELQYLLERAGVSIAGQGSNGIEAVELLRSQPADVLFLDVQMPGLDGFAVLRRLMAQETPLPQIVFATAFDQYAVRAFDVNAVDYLLKPFDERRLGRTLEKVRHRLEACKPDERTLPAAAPATLQSSAAEKLEALLRMMETGALQGGGSQAPGLTASASRSGKLVVRANQRLLLADERDVCFAAIEEGRISVVTRTLEGDSNCRTLEELAEQLDPEQFWRAHRSFLVNIQHIREVVPWFKSSFQLRMDDRRGTEIPVSRQQTRRLRELFKL